jgi:hypothetical protein
MPIRVFGSETDLLVDWCHVGSTRLDDPFFEQTVERCLRRPFNLAFRRTTSLADLEDWAGDDERAPAGLVFHMSRCGSTLVAQMLAALDEHVVISEAGPIDAVLRAPAPSEAVRVRRLRAMVAAIAHSQGPAAGRVFVKFDAWHALAIPTVRRAFADTPWVFLYREPVEVLASQAREPGSHTVPGVLPPALFGIDVQDVVATRHGEYGARVIGAICAAALEHVDEQALLVNYDNLPDAIEEIAAHLELDPTSEAWAQMRGPASFDAKTPSLPYEASRRAPSDEVRAWAERYLRASYDALETARRAQLSAFVATYAEGRKESA